MELTVYSVLLQTTSLSSNASTPVYDICRPSGAQVNNSGSFSWGCGVGEAAS